MQQPRVASATVALSAMGAATSMGDLIQAAAAARAGLVRARELTTSNCVDDETRETVPLIGHPASPLTYGFEGLGRLVQLCTTTLEDLWAHSPVLEPRRLEWFLCLSPELGMGTSPPRSPREVADRLVERLSETQRFPPRPESIHLFTEEREGTTRALSEAAQMLRERLCDHALVLACDSLVSPDRTEALLGARRLKTPDHPVGFMPGEAGVAVLLERRDTLVERGQRAHGLLFPPIRAHEPQCFKARAPPTGRALLEVLTQALAQAEAEQLPDGNLYLDLNGEEFRAREWGLTLLRARESCAISTWPAVLPALSFGETGTASPLLALCMAARAFARGYSRGQHALLLTSSDGGHRSATLLARTPDEMNRRH